MITDTPSVIRVATLGQMNIRRQLRNQGKVVGSRPSWEMRRRAMVRLVMDNRVWKAGRAAKVIPATTLYRVSVFHLSGLFKFIAYRVWKHPIIL